MSGGYCPQAGPRPSVPTSGSGVHRRLDLADLIERRQDELRGRPLTSAERFRRRAGDKWHSVTGAIADATDSAAYVLMLAGIWLSVAMLALLVVASFGLVIRFIQGAVWWAGP